MDAILKERRDTIATITLSHPERRNAITAAMWQALKSAFDELSGDLSLRCVVVQGAAGHFAGGADIAEFPQVRGDRERLRAYHEQIIAPALNAISACPHPTLAKIEGVCIGGGLEIAGRCDLRICATSARLGVPINRLGFPMAPDELAGLLSLVGRAVTLELLLEGRILSAAESLARGLVTRVVEDGAIETETGSTAKRIAEAAPIAARMNKALIARLCNNPDPLSADERAAAFSYADTRDHQEGVSAFLEGRTPSFRGH
ncbi:MAG: enoyl-CoA hydratase-related protein [Burkholderiaceae bacterium]|jgi:enoyl-CoA hydratase/carnithine racemase